MSDADKLRDANPWHPMTRPIDLKHLGKLSEELGEASTAVCSCIDLGMMTIDPVSGKANWQALQDELADVDANIGLVNSHFDLCVFRHSSQRLFIDERARLLSFGASLGIATAAVSRCIIQGINECEPVTGKLNRDWLREALTRVSEAIVPMVMIFDLDDAAMVRRVAKKTSHQRQWHGMLSEAAE